MKITFEYNDDEKHIVSWCLFKCSAIVGTNDGDEDPIEYKNKVSISNVYQLFNFHSKLRREIKERE